MSFALSCDPDIVNALDEEARAEGISRTKYINKVIQKTLKMPKVLSEGSCIEELEACSRLFEDEVMNKIPALAQKERRNIDQMLLYLIEIGIETMEKESSASEKITHETDSVIPFRKKHC
ncbi:MAG: hypothetical protein AB8B99_17630 [Phormidesmis sp.]